MLFLKNKLLFDGESVPDTPETESTSSEDKDTNEVIAGEPKLDDETSTDVDNENFKEEIKAFIELQMNSQDNLGKNSIDLSINSLTGNFNKEKAKALVDVIKDFESKYPGKSINTISLKVKELELESARILGQLEGKNLSLDNINSISEEVMKQLTNSKLTEIILPNNLEKGSNAIDISRLIKSLSEGINENSNGKTIIFKEILTGKNIVTVVTGDNSVNVKVEDKDMVNELKQQVDQMPFSGRKEISITGGAPGVGVSFGGGKYIGVDGIVSNTYNDPHDGTIITNPNEGNNPDVTVPGDGNNGSNPGGHGGGDEFTLTPDE